MSGVCFCTFVLENKAEQFWSEDFIDTTMTHQCDD